MQPENGNVQVRGGDVVATAEERQRAVDIKVGLFVLLGIILLVAVVFLIGQERHLFERPVYLRGQFKNVSGLKVGAQVLLGGVDVGIVSAIEFPTLDKGADGAVFDERVTKGLAVDSLLPVRGGPAVELLTPKSGEDDVDIDEAVLVKHAVALQDAPASLSLTVRSTDFFRMGVEVEGYDINGRKLRERLRVKTFTGEETTALGELLFARIARVRVIAIDGDVENAFVRMGISTARKITILLRIRKDVLERIRHDSRVAIDSMGLLGDKTVNITIGSSQSPAHTDGDLLRSVPSADLNEIIAEAQHAYQSLTEGGLDLPGMINQIADGKLVGAIQRVERILGEVESGGGLLHEIFYDEKSGTDYTFVVADLRRAMNKINKTIADVDGAIADVKKNDSIAHALFFAEGGEKTIASAESAINEAKLILEDVRTKEGLIHQLIYREDNGAAVTNITQVTEDLKVTTADVRALVESTKKGEGTVGALLKDPTVYEDLKILLGNMKRNDAMRALVRYTIEREDQAAIATPKKP
jgi:phospholipid/cholesterol/gamma-HCH transport system substrate-binding protein